MAKIKRAMLPLLCCCFCYFNWSEFSFSCLSLSLTHTENAIKRNKAKTKRAKKDMALDAESRRCTYLCKRLRYIAILSKSVTINSMMCTEIMRQAAINFRFIDHGLRSDSLPLSLSLNPIPLFLLYSCIQHTRTHHSLLHFPHFHRSFFSCFPLVFWNFLFPVYISDKITHK